MNPAVVFSSAMHINQRLLLLKPFFRDVKFIVRNDNYLYTLPPLKRLCLKLTYRFAECVIAQTEEMGAEVSMFVDAEKVHVLDNPIDEELIESKLRAPSPFAGRRRFDKIRGVGPFRLSKGVRHSCRGVRYGQKEVAFAQTIYSRELRIRQPQGV